MEFKTEKSCQTEHIFDKENKEKNQKKKELKKTMGILAQEDEDSDDNSEMSEGEESPKDYATKKVICMFETH